MMLCWSEILGFFHTMFRNVFPSCSQRVPQVLIICPKMFPIAPHFYSIHFAQSCLFNYIKGPNVKHPHLSIENSILGSLQSFNFLLWWVSIKMTHCKKKKKKKEKELGEPPHVCDGNKSWIWIEQIVNVLMGGYLHYLSSKFVNFFLKHCGIHKYEVSHPL